MASFLSRAALAATAYYIGRGIYQYVREKKYSFKGKVVLITGGSRGLGLVMARQLAQEGALLSICARNTRELEEARQQLKQHGARVLAIPADITAPDAAEKVVGQTLSYYGHLDVLINNAGQIIVGPLKSQTLQAFDALMQLYFYAPLRFIDAALPALRRQQGRILNISSIGGKISVPHLLSYSTGKFALTGLSEGLYAALKREGVVVTTACPDLMRTGSPLNVDVVGKYEEEYRWFKISDSLPLLSMHAEKAAHKLLNACRRGDPECILTLPAKAAVLLHGISPSLFIRMSELANRFLLPEPIENTIPVKGHETRYDHSPNPLTKPTDKAAAKNNER